MFLKVWESLHRFRLGETSFRGWLYRVAQNLLIDRFRTQKRELPIAAAEELSSPQPTPEDQFEADMRKRLVVTAISELKPNHQQALTLRFIDGLSHAKAGAVLGRNQGAIRAMQHRALKALKSRLEQIEEFHLEH